MVIIPLLVIELKATPNGNPSDDFYWRHYRGLVPLPPFLNRWQFRNPPLVLASSNVTFGSIIVYGIRLSPNDYVLVLCFGIPFQEVPIFPFSVFDFFGYRDYTPL